LLIVPLFILFLSAGQVLSTSVDQGASYFDMASVKESFEKSGGLTATTLKTFMPDRTNRVYGKLRVSKESVLETRLDDVGGMSLTAFKHSGYGKGFRIEAADMYIFEKQKDQQRPLPKTKAPSGSIPLSRDIGSSILDFIGDTFDNSRKKKQGEKRKRTAATQGLEKTLKRAEIEKALRDCGVPLVAPVGVNIVQFVPSCSSLDTATRNPKQHLRSKKARPGEGKNHKDQRNRRRLVRLVKRKQKLQLELLQNRAEQRAAGLHLCPFTHPLTRQYCKKRCESAKGLTMHLKKGSHDYPGSNSNDSVVLKASRPGGLLAAGNRPNLKSEVLFVTIEEAPADAIAIKRAVCYGKFNRKELSYDDIYHKPSRLAQALLELYQIGQDGGCPKLKGREIWKRLRDMRDPTDGGLMFCYSKRGSWPRDKFCNLCEKDPCDCNGMLPEVKRVQEFMNSETQKRRKKRKVQEEAEATIEPEEECEEDGDGMNFE
jgi:hypothetical protein